MKLEFDIDTTLRIDVPVMDVIAAIEVELPGTAKEQEAVVRLVSAFHGVCRSLSDEQVSKLPEVQKKIIREGLRQIATRFDE